MADGYRDIVHAAFESSEWRTSADSVFQATGTSVSVMDFAEGTMVSTTGRCGFCHLATGAGSPGPESCFDVPPDPGCGACRITCRAGLSTELRPVLYEGESVAHVVTAGFVTSTRERKRLYELLLVRGVREESARLALKALPIVSRRAAESWAGLAVTAANAALAAERGRRISAERTEDMAAVLAAGRRVLGATSGEPAALAQLVTDVATIADAPEGALYLPTRDGRLEVAAVHGHWMEPVGTRISRDGTLVGRAFVTRRSVLSPTESGRRDRAIVALPVAVGERVLGVLEFAVSPLSLPLSADRAVRLERFMRFVAVTLDRMAERQRSARSIAANDRLNTLASGLGGKTDLDAIAKLVTSSLSKSFAFQVAGLLLDAWGMDRADVVLNAPVASSDLEGLLAEASGRSVEDVAREDVRFAGPGAVDAQAESHEEWSTMVVELEGDDLTIGSLFIASADGTRYGTEDREFLEGIAEHAAAALQRAAMFARVRDDYAKTIAALSASLETHHRPASAHGGRVMEFALLVGDELGLSRDELEALRFAGLVHEIGVAGLPHEILLRPSHEAVSELARLGAHAKIGASVAQQIEFLKSITPVVLHHHERWDGTGYPAGLAGEAIPELARVLAVADAFAELTAPSPDRLRMTFWEAREHVESAAGAQFDPAVVAALCSALDRQGRLGATGLVSSAHESTEPQLPV